MTFLTAVTGLSLVLAVALASGTLCYLMLAGLNRLEVAAAPRPVPVPVRTRGDGRAAR